MSTQGIIECPNCKLRPAKLMEDGIGQCCEHCGNWSPETKPESISHPPHYGGDTTYEAIKVIEAWNLGFSLGNAVKYIARAGKKSADAVEDLEKAAWYIDREIQRLKAAKS